MKGEERSLRCAARHLRGAKVKENRAASVGMTTVGRGIGKEKGQAAWSALFVVLGDALCRG
jgi:hypothetical protein